MAYVIGAVLAAGRGVRMGGPKAGLVVGGLRLVDRAIAVLTAGGCDRVVAVVGADIAVDGAAAIVNPAPERGMRSSLALAVDASADIAALGSGDGEVLANVGLCVLLVDTPGIDAAAVRAVLERWRSNPVRIAVGQFADGPVIASPLIDRRSTDLRPVDGRSAGRRGHPTVMALRRWQAAVLVAGADEGARRYLNSKPDLIDEVSVSGDPADLDRPEDLQAWRDRH